MVLIRMIHEGDCVGRMGGQDLGTTLQDTALDLNFGQLRNDLAIGTVRGAQLGETRFRIAACASARLGAHTALFAAV